MLPSKNVAWLLLTLLTICSSAQTYPSIAEVDLLFPGNDTYEPTVLMPMVFAIQNSSAAAYLNLVINWVLYYPADGEFLTIIRNNVIHNTYLTAYTPGPFYEYTGLYNLTTLEGKWKLVWTLTSENCTQFPLNNSTAFGYDQVNTVIFTTKNGAQEADLVAATADDVCASAESFSFNVTGEERVSVGEGGPGVTTCAIVTSMSPTATPNPCAAQLDAARASSISASITANACGPTSLVTCPAKSAGSIGGRLQVGGLNWVVLTFGWLLYSILK